MRRMSRGFTIIELLVVVSVIGILSTISFTGFNRYQADTRDSQRQSQATILAEALEKYYDQNGEYPGCPAMTAAAASVTTTTLPGVDPKVLFAPQDTTGEDNSIKCQDLTSVNSPDIFAYVGDGSTVCSTGASCLSFTLKYRQESTGTITSVSSRRQATLASSGDITDLSATTFSFSRVDLNWTAVSGATTYNVQYSTSASFTSPTTFTPAPTTNSVSVTGLTLGTTYYFRVQPATATTTGNWSNVSSATTFTLDTPSGTCTVDGTLPASKLDFSWGAVANATSYNVQYANNSAMTSPTTITGATNPTTVSGLSAGTTLYFQVKAVAAGYTSGWSTKCSATTTVPVPTGLTATTNSSSQITASWNYVSVATSYTLDYSTDSNFASPAPTTTLTSTSGKITGIGTGGTTISKAVTGLQQGTTIYFRVYALVGVTSSLASSSASATTSIDGASGLGITAYRPGAVRPYAAGYWIAWINSPASGNWYYAYADGGASCPAGAYPVYQFYSQFNSPTTGYYTGATTAAEWFMAQPTSGYKIKFGMQAYCQGPNTNSGWSGWVYSCAANPGSTVACTF